MFIESTTGDDQPSHGADGTEEKPKTDTAQVTATTSTTSEELKTAVNGLDPEIQKSDSSSSDTKVTSIAHHAHTPTLEETEELLTKNQESMFIES
jgi:hypothetical protein